MTDPAILEALIFMTHEIIDRVYDEDGTHRDMADEIAAAVLELVGPRPLVWESPCEANNRCHIARTPRGDYYVDVDGGRHQAWMESLTKPYEVQIGEPVGDMFAAKTAAQNHADAAHWANTKIVGE